MDADIATAELVDGLFSLGLAAQQCVRIMADWVSLLQRTIRRALGYRYAYATPLRRRKHGGRWQSYRDVRANWQAVQNG